MMDTRVETTKQFRDSDLCEAFGQRFNTALAKSGHTQAEVARHLEISRTAVQQYSVGKNMPTASNCIKMARFLGTTPEFLFFGVRPGKEIAAQPSDTIRIPVVEKVDGKERTVSEMLLPESFIASKGVVDAKKLKAITMITDNGDGFRTENLVVIDTTRRELSKEPTPYVLTNSVEDRLAWLQPIKKNRVNVRMDGEEFETDLDRSIDVVGRVIANVGDAI